MVDQGLSIGAVPTVKLNTPTALLERSDVSINRTITGHLVANEVGVVRAVDEIVRQRLAHVLVNIFSHHSV